ncbi:MAG: hypothetical protein EPN39_16785 [Chitinophagaceae bacterium]|nr:MAG: hypothetical protein EPN39_16785 [Chitinophagaceae bacterium]
MNITQAQNVFPTTGNVGIGTATPTVGLQIVNRGILLNNPEYYPYGIDIDLSFPGGWAREYSFSYNNMGKLFSLGAYGDSSNLVYGYVGGNSAAGTVYDIPWMVFLPSGNVLIGKTSQTNTSYKLDVNGNIRANQVTVNATGADYIFDSAYHLPSLDSLSIYLKRYHHLPGITSAKQMQTNGVNLGQNQTKLLKKIEELTLYVIEEDKMNRQLQTNLDALKKEVESLKNNSK